MNRTVVATAEGPLGQRIDTVHETGYFFYKCGACGQYERHNRNNCDAYKKTTAFVKIYKSSVDGNGDPFVRLAAHVRVGNRYFVQNLPGGYYNPYGSMVGDLVNCNVLPGSRLEITWGQKYIVNIIVP